MQENASGDTPRVVGPLMRLGLLTSFSVWGLLSFLIGLGVLYLLFDVSGFPYWIAVPFSIMVHLAVHYWCSRSFVFRKSARSLEEGFLLFVLIGIAEIVLITGLTTLVVEYAMGDVYWTRIIVGVAVALGGFWANARYNFKAL